MRRHRLQEVGDDLLKRHERVDLQTGPGEGHALAAALRACLMSCIWRERGRSFSRPGASKRPAAKLVCWACRELGIAPLSAVMAGLDLPVANFSHCRLSSKGARALGHALACNVVIQRLMLQDNHIDGVVSGRLLCDCGCPGGRTPTRSSSCSGLAVQCPNWLCSECSLMCLPEMPLCDRQC